MSINFANNTLEFNHWRPELGRVFSTAFAFDTETMLIDEEHDWLPPCYVLGAACDGERGFFVPRQHLAAFLKAHWGLEMIFHNAAFDLPVMQAAVGAELDLYDLADRNLIWDTLLLHRLLVLATEGHTARNAGQSTLETCVRTYLNEELPKDVVDSAGDQVRTSYGKWLSKPLGDIEPVYLEYLAKDVLATWLVYQELRAEIDEVLNTSESAFNFVSEEHLNQQIELWGPLTHHIQLKASLVLREIRSNGLRIDTCRLKQLADSLDGPLKALRARLRDLDYLPGPGSQKAMQAILARDERNCGGITFERTKTGMISTSAESLAPFREQVPFIDAYLQYQELQKLFSTYLDKMSKTTLHPKFQVLLESGRTSSYGDINAQNIPKRADIRSCFVPSPGHVYLIADYSTLELVTLAQTTETLFGRDSRMGDLIVAGEDLHRSLATELTGKSAAEITAEERQMCKAINFGKPGGMGIPRLIQYAKATFGVEMTLEQAKEFIAAWESKFPEVKEYLNRNKYEAYKRLAKLLGLTAQDFNEGIGGRASNESEPADYEPAGWLGWMCLESLGEEQPYTSEKARGGVRPYTDAELDYFWQKMQAHVELFPEELHADILARKPSLELKYKLRNWLTAAPVFTTTGRLRANAGYCQQKNTPFQGLAADGAKLALWKLWRAGYRIVNFIHDEVVVEVPEDCDLAAELAMVKRLMIDGMREVVPDITVRVEGYVSRSWSKDGKIELEPTVSDPESPPLSAAA